MEIVKSDSFLWVVWNETQSNITETTFWPIAPAQDDDG
jgi:hypothetical protein